MICPSDDHFGPVVNEYCRSFDFTLFFEDSILAALPSLVFLIAACARIAYIRKVSVVVLSRDWLLCCKQITVLIYGTLQLAVLILWTIQYPTGPWPIFAAGTLALLDVPAFFALSYFEHVRNRRPSTVFLLYLFFSTLFDIVRVRTLWFLRLPLELPLVFTISLGFKIFIMILEACEKNILLIDAVKSPEETSSIFNQAVFYWINPLFWIGARRRLRKNDLFGLQIHMKSETLMQPFLNSWTKYRRSDLALLRVLKLRIARGIVPRLFMIGFNLSGPLLIKKLLDFLENRKAAPPSTGYGLIGAFGLVYLGRSFATALANYNNFQVLSMIRGSLISTIGWKVGRLRLYAQSDSHAAVSLMSTDMERIILGLQFIHEIWAAVIQASIATYLLGRQMGVACVAPVVIVVICSGATIWSSGRSTAHQKKWMEAVQSRVAITSNMLSSMKSVKMRGLEDVVLGVLQELRAKELRQGSRFRYITMLTVVIGFVPQLVGSAMTFLIFLVRTHANGSLFHASTVFTSLSLLTVLSEPLNATFQTLPMVAAAYGSLRRIDAFLLSEEQEDPRKLISDSFSSETISIQEEKAAYFLPETIDSMLRDSRRSALQIKMAGFGYSTEKVVLQNITVSIPRGGLTCIVGEVASGKSTLCRALIGEILQSKGTIEIRTGIRNIAYCDQNVFLRNETVKENIVSFSPWDAKWYNVVVDACALRPDLLTFPGGDEYRIGSDGRRLSGGQRQKLALARAVYSRIPVVLLDDILSGLDAWSTQQVFQNVFGREGLTNTYGATVILSTNDLKILPEANYIIALGPDGSVSQHGTYAQLIKNPGYIRNISMRESKAKDPAGTAEVVLEKGQECVEDQYTEQDSSLRTGDWEAYAHYFGRAGHFNTAGFLLAATVSAGLYTAPSYWLKIWTQVARNLGDKNYGYWAAYAAMQFGGLAAIGLFCYFALIRVIERAGLGLHQSLATALMNATWSYLARTDAGKILNRFSHDLQLIDTELAFGLLNCVVNILIAIGQMTLIIVASPWTGLVFPPILLMLYFIQKFYLRTSRQLRILELEAKSPLYTHFTETLSGLSTLRSFGWIDENLCRLLVLLDISQQPDYLMRMIQRWLEVVLDITISCVTVLLVAISVIEGANSSSVGVALTQVIGINITFTSLIISWTQVETCMGAVSRVISFSQDTPVEHLPEETQIPPPSWPQAGSMNIKDLTVAYTIDSQIPALKNVNLNVRAGERIGICGRSGSGKSSTALALLRMVEIQGGSIEIDDVSLRYVARNPLRRMITALPQEALLLPGSVRWNLDPFQTSTDKAIAAAIEVVGLSEVVKSHGGLDVHIDSLHLSNGQRQLFCLASAILSPSKVVILDEVTSSTDIETDNIMQRIIRDSFQDRTVITIAHRLWTLSDYDRIIVLNDGQIDESSNISGFLVSDDSKFKEIFAVQNNRS